MAVLMTLWCDVLVQVHGCVSDLVVSRTLGSAWLC